MLEENTTELEVENQAENETLETDQIQIDEGTEGEDVNKEEGDDDYFKSENARLKEKLEKQDQIIGYKNRAIKAMKKKKAVDEVEDVYEEEETQEQVSDREYLDRKLAEIRLEERASAVDDEIMKRASSKDEAEVIRFHLQNSIKTTGNIRDDVETAQWLANKKRFMSQDAEKTQALISRNTSSSRSFAGQRQATSTKTYKPTAEDRRSADQFFGGDIKRYLKYKNK